MRSLSRWAQAMVVATAVAAAPVPAQQTSQQKIETARQLLEASKFDSAVALLQQVIAQDSTARLSAYVWLGIVHHFAGRDSLARAAFRQAYTIDRDLQLQGVGELDPTRLPQLLAEERATARGESVGDSAPAAPAPPDSAPAAPAPPDSAAAAGPPTAKCLPGCVGMDRPPEFVSMPRVAFPDHLRDAARSLDLVVRVIVDTAGHVERGSVQIVRSNVASMGADIINALSAARFRPARAAGGSVRALIELTFRARTQGGSLVLAPPARL